MKPNIVKLALGTAQFGLDYGISNSQGKTSLKEVGKILELAQEQNITIIDTAQEYGNSESILGEIHENRFKIITKINPQVSSIKTIETVVEESLTNLKVNSVYGVLFHSPQTVISNPYMVEKIKLLKNEGKIEKFGYSVYFPNELEDLITKYGMPDIVQLPFNHLDTRFESIATNHFFY